MRNFFVTCALLCFDANGYKNVQNLSKYTLKCAAYAAYVYVNLHAAKITKQVVTTRINDCLVNHLIKVNSAFYASAVDKSSTAYLAGFEAAFT